MSNGNKFRGGNDYQVSQWNDCARLISNCLINYNSALLSAFNQGKTVVDLAGLLSSIYPLDDRAIELAV
tara:strand:- start:337 stop:543 length:207 start_codon:yes stop_codon:yes gene_type:complete